jgi:predicted ATPase/DNA-binding CsgD family transcriptional regulator
MVVSGTETVLPIPLSSFIGRQSEIEALCQLLASEARLITLTGPGGIGKTRLALQTTEQIANDFSDGAHFIPLESLDEPRQVLPAITNALNVSESGERPLFEDLSQALADRHILLCLDNFEHVLEAAPQLTDLLRACPQLHILATSREALRLRGEQEFPVGPLELPLSPDRSQSEAAAQSPAVQLFLDRARAVRSGFELDEDNLSTIVDICYLLDGLPLALELAAALLRLFSPQVILTRLKSSPGLKGTSPAMQLLAGGARDLPVRQQTLRATIDWSYSLLDAADRRMFRWLSVFSGGCTLEAAEFICSDETAGPRPILDFLIPLVDKNLIRSDQRNGEPRFSLLRTIREYALEQLEGHGELRDARERHIDYYLEMVEHAETELKGPDQARWLERLELEHDNLRAALSWSLENGRYESGFRLAGALWRFWLNRGHITEGRQWLDTILSTNADVSIEIKIKVLNGAGALAWSQGDYAISRKFHTECLNLRKLLEDVPGVAASLHNLGVIALFQDDFETASSYFQESVTLYREVGDRWGEADGKLQLGSVLRNKKDFEGAQRYIEESLALLQELGDTQGVAGALHSLGLIALDQANYDRAYQYFMEGKSLFTDLGDRWGMALSDYNLGLIALHQKNLQNAETLFIESLTLKRDLGDKIGIAYCLEGMACLAAERSAVERAAQLFGAAEALRKSIGASLSGADRANYDRYLEMARAQLKVKAFTIATRAGEEMNLDQAVQYALNPQEGRDSKVGQDITRRSHPAGLTSREVEVLNLLAQGLSDVMISEELVISPRTVNAHLTSIYGKLGVNSRAAATRFAIEKGLT